MSQRGLSRHRLTVTVPRTGGGLTAIRAAIERLEAKAEDYENPFDGDCDYEALATVECKIAALTRKLHAAERSALFSHILCDSTPGTNRTPYE